MSTKLGTILADFTTALSTDIAVGGTTATLSSATDDDGVALPSGRYFFTLDGSNSSKEHISCDLVGTALTNIKSLSRQGVETTGAVRKHRIGTSVSLTDFGHIKFINDLVSGATNLNGTAPLGYDSEPTSLSGSQLATVTYVLGVVNGGAVTFDQQTISNQTSGEALAINDVVYFKEADAKWYKADADLTATFDQLQIGINKTTATGSGEVIQIAISGPVSAFSGLTAGSKYYLSNTAGAITTTAGTNSVFIGWALNSTTLLFNPILKTLPTQKEKDALVGSQGVVSSTNKYISQDNVYTSGIDQSQTTQNTTIETGEANATTKRNKVAQSFTAGKTKVRGFALWKTANTGTFTGTVTVSLQSDTTGSPSGAALLTKTITNAEYNALSVGAFDVIFSSEYSSLVLGTTYWIVIETSTSDTSNHPNIGTNSAGGYSGGSVKTWNTTDGWTAVAAIDLYFKTYEGVVSQVSMSKVIKKVITERYLWQKSQGLTYLDVELIGGGAGGAGASGASGGGSAGTPGAGGGAGGYCRRKLLAEAIPDTVVITIGAGGTGTTGVSYGSSATNNPGGDTMFGSIATAFGAGSGTGGTAGTISIGGSSITVGLVGGNGVAGTGGHPTTGTGGTGGSNYIYNSVGNITANTDGTNGYLGCGGNGGGSPGPYDYSGGKAGGNGGSGFAILTEYYL